MAKTNTAVFAQTPMFGAGVLINAAGNTASNVPTNLVQLAQVGAEGAIITAASVIPQGTTTAACVGLYVSVDAGATKYLLETVGVTAYTASVTDKTPKFKFSDITEDNPVRVPANAILYGATMVAVANGLAIKVEYTNF